MARGGRASRGHPLGGCFRRGTGDAGRRFADAGSGAARRSGRRLGGVERGGGCGAHAGAPVGDNPGPSGRPGYDGADVAADGRIGCAATVRPLPAPGPRRPGGLRRGSCLVEAPRRDRHGRQRFREPFLGRPTGVSAYGSTAPGARPGTAADPTRPDRSPFGGPISAGVPVPPRRPADGAAPVVFGNPTAAGTGAEDGSRPPPLDEPSAANRSGVHRRPSALRRRARHRAERCSWSTSPKRPRRRPSAAASSSSSAAGCPTTGSSTGSSCRPPPRGRSPSVPRARRGRPSRT